MKTRLTTTEIHHEDGKEVTKEVSIFKNMYHQLLKTIDNHGCVLTDYKSFPLLEEKFWKIVKEISDRREQGLESTPLQHQHFEYLKKILPLLENKADENMDEFDQPNRPIQKIQVDLGGGHFFNRSRIEHTLEIYNHLLEDEILGLQKNIQGDLTEEMRQKSITHAAQKMAEKIAPNNPKLLDYFLGKNEDILPEMEQWDPKLQDKTAFCKDQFTTFLPIALRGKQGSRYKRSEDGKRTLPCHGGEPHDAKFGTTIEQSNAITQDYLSKGITTYDLQIWFKQLKIEFDQAETEEKREEINAQVQEFFPTST